MKSLLFIFLSFLSLSLAYSIWPQPQVFTRGSTNVTLEAKSLMITTHTPSSSNLLKNALARYEFYFFPFPSEGTVPDLPLLTSLTVTVLSDDETLQLGVNENYTLSVTTDGATITADTVFGALRGLESFAQLIDFSYTAKTYTIQGLPIYVEDYPRFAWRGVMIDTGRHYLEPQTILTMIDAIAFNKMNTLHWHATDSQSFPIYSKNYPKLAEGGAYNFPDAIYTTEDIVQIVQYAYERGVRVVPEFDVPGHSYSWGLGNPGLTLNCSVPLWGIGGITLDVTNPNTYTVLSGFLSEMKSLFMDDHMHLGSDEVIYECWNSTPAVLDWMKEHGMTSFNELEQYFEDNLYKVTQNIGLNNRIFWEDAYISNGISFDHNTSMFEVWINKGSLVNITKAGYKAILANGYYLDVQQPGPTVHYEWVDTWQDFYTNEPFSGLAANLTDAERALVLGGEACMWGEAVEDENIMSRVWIRASGAAERLWSAYDFTNNADLSEVETRIIELRCRLKRRGIHATAVRPDYCPSLV